MRAVAKTTRTKTQEGFLEEASAILASSFDYQGNLALVVRLAVPLLADSCAAELAEETGAAQPREAVGVDAAKQGRLAVRLAAIRAAVLRSGVAHRSGSLIVAPLLGRGRTLGTLTLALVDADRHYSPSDLALTQELAGQASLAIEGARLDKKSQAARDDLFALISHDLQNPLNTLHLHAQLLQKAPAAIEENRRESAESIQRAVERMNRLICDLVDARSIGRGELSLATGRHQVRHLVDELLGLFQSRALAKSLRLQGPLPRDDRAPAVLGDRGRILQVMSSLLDNAIKFTAKGGTVTVAVEPLGTEVQFSVADSGYGISAADIPRTFDPYGRAGDLARNGTGFGLLIAKGIVEALGGRIWVESKLGVGSTFFVALPSVT